MARLTQDTLIPADLREAAEGATTWGEYVRGHAENSGLDFDAAWALFDMLGESEAFDGFVTAVEDAEDF